MRIFDWIIVSVAHCYWMPVTLATGKNESEIKTTKLTKLSTKFMPTIKFRNVQCTQQCQHTFHRRETASALILLIQQKIIWVKLHFSDIKSQHILEIGYIERGSCSLVAKNSSTKPDVGLTEIGLEQVGGKENRSRKTPKDPPQSPPHPHPRKPN